MIPTKEEWRAALAARHGKDRQERFERATVAIFGLGGLGSNVAIMLARAGVGKLILIDFDRVDVANLNRQQYRATQVGELKTEALAANLREISPWVELAPRTARVDEENAVALARGADVVCEAFDDPAAKALLVNATLEKTPEKFLVAASGMAGFGDANAIRTRRIAKRFYLCGDAVSDVADGDGLVASRVTLCAAHEAHAILRFLAREDGEEEET